LNDAGFVRKRTDAAGAVSFSRFRRSSSMSKRTLPSPEEQVVAAELLLLRSLGVHRRQASWKMALDRQSVIAHAPLEAAQPAARGRRQAKSSRQGATGNSPPR
jgi:hypothetical protein